MKWGNWLEKWKMTSLKIKAPFLDMEWSPKDQDKSAAWELYVELLTRITAQPLNDDCGDNKTALSSIHSIFYITRTVLKNNGRHCSEFTKIAVIVLNQVIRPFTAKWHRLSLTEAFDSPTKTTEFRNELKELQETLQIYTKMLAEMADVEDLTEISD